MLKQVFFSLIGLALINGSTAQKNKPKEASTGGSSKVVSATPTQPGKTAEAFYNDGIKLKDQKNYTAALVSFKQAIAKNSNYKEAYYQAGWCCNELAKYADALTYLRRAKTLWPEEAKVLLELGYANQQSGNTSEAKDNFTKCLSLKDDYALAYQYLGNLYFTDKNYEKALENYESYSRYEPDITSGTIYYKMGYCQNEKEKYDDAVKSLKKAISLKADYTEAYNELGYAYTKLENSEDALSNYNEALRTNPKSDIAYNGIGDVYKSIKKDMDEAVKNYLKALAINPKNKKSNYLIGWCYNDKGKYNDAVPYLKKALEIDKDYVSAITELGYCDYALENYDDALKLFNRAMVINKTELSVYYAGLCYIGKKDKDNATKMFNDLTDMNSSYADKLKQKIDKL